MPAVPKPKKKVSPAVKRRRAVKEADRYFSRYIRERDNYVCCTCGRDKYSGAIQCGHLFTRSMYSVRWDEDNAKAQCSACNMRHEYDFGPMSMVWLTEHGQQGYQDLYQKAHKTTKFKTFEIEEIAQKYKDLLENLIETREALLAKGTEI